MDVYLPVSNHISSCIKLDAVHDVSYTLVNSYGMTAHVSV